jgi:putative spermidine/putrescine transport system permease protein
VGQGSEVLTSTGSAKRGLSSRLGLSSFARTETAPSWLWAVPSLLFLMLFFVLPLFDNAARSVATPSGLSAVAYARFFGDVYYWGVLAQTIALSAVATLLCLLVGYPVAFFLVRHSGTWAGLLMFCLVAPLLTSIVMRTFGWRALLGRQGLINMVLLDLGMVERPLSMASGIGTVLVALVHVLVPFMVLSIAGALQGIDRRLEESARILGAGRIATFARVTFPLSLDGVATGCILVFMIANGSFVTLLLLGGGSIQTIPLLIYQHMNSTRDFGLISAMSNILLATAIGCLVLQSKFIRRRQLAK